MRAFFVHKYINKEDNKLTGQLLVIICNKFYDNYCAYLKPIDEFYTVQYS